MYLVIAGNIGAGKTSLAQILSRELGFSVYFEAFGENPFLPSYYQQNYQNYGWNIVYEKCQCNFSRTSSRFKNIKRKHSQKTNE